MRVAVILAAGGLVGQAFHLGVRVLTGLQEATGFDARAADVLVGSSAGALVAAGLRACCPRTTCAPSCWPTRPQLAALLAG